MIVVILQALLCAYFLLISPAAAQTNGPAAYNTNLYTAPIALSPLAAGSTVSPDQAQPTLNPISEYTDIVWQAAEQNKDITASTTSLFDTAGAGAPPWFLRLLNAFLNEIGSIVAKWLHDFVVHWEAPAASTLALVIQQQVFNPNVTASDQSGSGVDTIAPQVRQLNTFMYVIAQDLLLLIFILAMWRTWAQSTSHNGANLAGPILRLSFTTALLLGWPTLNAFIIEISNEMIRAIYPASGTTDAVQLAKALEALIDLGVDASGAALIAMLSPLAATVIGAASLGSAGAAAGNIAGQSISFVAMLIFTVLASALIFQLVYIVTMQSAQTVLLYAQYIFAPFFLLFFAHPDTETIATRYIHAVVEASLWSFIWVGLLRLLVIFMTSPFNVWGQILYAIAVFQLMINTPQFIAKAHISPLSDFVSAGLFSNRTVTLIRSYSRQARQLGVQTGKTLTGEHRGVHTTRKTSSSIKSKSVQHSDTSATAVGLPLDSIWTSNQDPSSSARPVSFKQEPNSVKLRPVDLGSELNTTSDVEPSFIFGPTLSTNFVNEPIATDIIIAPRRQAIILDSNNSTSSITDTDEPRHDFEADPLTIAQSSTLISQTPNVSDAIKTPTDAQPLAITYGNTCSQIICDSAGAFKLKTVPGTSPAEFARLHSIVSYARLSQQDPHAHSAAASAAGNSENAYQSNPISNEVQTAPKIFSQNNLSIIKHAVLGAQSYINGEPGNGYCVYLEQRFHPAHNNTSAPISTDDKPFSYS